MADHDKPYHFGSILSRRGATSITPKQ